MDNNFMFFLNFSWLTYNKKYTNWKEEKNYKKINRNQKRNSLSTILNTKEIIMTNLLKGKTSNIMVRLKNNYDVLYSE